MFVLSTMEIKGCAGGEGRWVPTTSGGARSAPRAFAHSGAAEDTLWALWFFACVQATAVVAGAPHQQHQQRRQRQRRDIDDNRMGRWDGIHKFERAFDKNKSWEDVKRVFGLGGDGLHGTL